MAANTSIVELGLEVLNTVPRPHRNARSGEWKLVGRLLSHAMRGLRYPSVVFRLVGLAELLSPVVRTGDHIRRCSTWNILGPSRARSTKEQTR